MPLRMLGDAMTLVCANDCHLSEPAAPRESTMRRAVGWLALIKTEPDPSGAPRLDFSRGNPVALFLCPKCGYVELYAGTTVDPAAWPPHQAVQ